MQFTIFTIPLIKTKNMKRQPTYATDLKVFIVYLREIRKGYFDIADYPNYYNMTNVINTLKEILCDIEDDHIQLPYYPN